MIAPPDNVKEFLVYRASYSAEYEVFVFNGVSVSTVVSALRDSTALSPDVVSNTKTYIFKDPSNEEFRSRELLREWVVRCGNVPEIADYCSSWRLYACVDGAGFPPNYQDHPLEASIQRKPRLIKKRMVPVDMFDPLAGMVESFPFYD